MRQDDRRVLARMLGLTREDLQILRRVVVDVAVNVMDDLSGEQRAPQLLLSYDAVLMAIANLFVRSRSGAICPVACAGAPLPGAFAKTRLAIWKEPLLAVAAFALRDRSPRGA